MWRPLIFTLLLLMSGCREQPRAYDVDGKPVDVFAGGGKAVALTFVSVDCPISNRYLPELERLSAEHRERDVSFWLVYPNAKDGVDDIRRHRKEYDISIPFVRDLDHALVKLSRATVTPEVAVFDDHRRMHYRGRIDDRYIAFGKYRQKAEVHDLDVALRADAPATLRTTKAIGCAIIAPE